MASHAEETRSFAKARLLRDFKEIENYPLSTVYAQPLESNIFEWHASLIAPAGTDYEGCCFHLIFIFPEDYPHNPPKVRLLTTVSRDHVFGEWICLDMLRSWAGFKAEKYTGWSTAYTTLSILLQLQAFIFEPDKDTSIASMERCAKHAANYKCSTCPHDMTVYKVHPWRDGMLKPLTREQIDDKYKSHKRQWEIEKEIEAKVRAAMREKGIVHGSAAYDALYKRVAAETNQKMKEEIEKNRIKLQKLEAERKAHERKEKEKQKKIEEQNQTVQNYVPGADDDDLPSKKKKKKKQPAVNNNNNMNGLQGNNNNNTNGIHNQEIPLVKEEPKKEEPKPLTPEELQKIEEKNRRDKLFSVLWTTKLNPLAGEFVPRNGVATAHIHPSEAVVEVKNNSFVQEEQEVFGWEACPPEILFIIFSLLKERKDLIRCSLVCHLWNSVILNNYMLEKIKVALCFHSKLSWEEDTLGIGLVLRKHPKSGELQYVDTPLDLISHTSFFVENVRKSVWQENFTHWVPLFLNKTHGRKAMKMLPAAVSTIYEKPFTPWLAIDLFSKLMNTMIVNVMSDNLHASIAALQGYCYFHRMMIACVQEWPELREEIDFKIKSFLSDEEMRHKRNCPSIGDFLPLVTVSHYSWINLAVPIVKETLARNVLWVLKAHPVIIDWYHKTDIEEATERLRLEKTFESSRTSLRLLMFHVYFLNNVAKVGTVPAEEVALEYDIRFGQPTHKMQTELQQAIFKIQKIKTFFGFFKNVRMPPPSEQYLFALTRECIDASARKRYHKEWLLKNGGRNNNSRPIQIDKTPRKPKHPGLNTDDDFGGYEYANHRRTAAPSGWY